MSRIGRMAIKIPDKVTVIAEPGLVKVEGPKGKLSQKLDPSIKVVVENGEVRVLRPDDQTRSRELHGLSRTLVNNMVLGVTVGYSRTLEISGVGYKAELKDRAGPPAGQDVNLVLGFSHPITYPLPDGVSAEYDAKANRLTVRGADKHLIGLIAAEIRKLRPPEPYKGKGIKYQHERIRRKQGKTGVA
jgi:large subunit ribosomal protein L6